MRTDGQTDVTNLIVAFRSFVSSPKNARLLASDCMCDIGICHSVVIKIGSLLGCYALSTGSCRRFEESHFLRT
jgi:hypothetical protein